MFGFADHSTSSMLFQGFSCSNRSLLSPFFLHSVSCFILSLSLPPSWLLSFTPFSSAVPLSCMLSWTLQKILVGMVKFCCCLPSLVFIVLTPPTHCSLLGKSSVCVLVCGLMLMHAFLHLLTMEPCVCAVLQDD